MLREHQARERAAGDALRVLLRLFDRGPDLRDPARQLVRGERRRQHDLSHEVEAERQIFLQHRKGDLHPVPAGARSQTSTDELDRRVELGSAALRRAARQEPAHDVREPGAIRWVEQRAPAREEPHRDDGHGRSLGHEQDHAVRQHLAVRDRSRGERRRTGHRGDDHHDQEQDAGESTGHDPIIREARAATSHGSGSRMPTLFLFSSNHRRATRVMSAAVTARMRERYVSSSA